MLLNQGLKIYENVTYLEKILPKFWDFAKRYSNHHQQKQSSHCLTRTCLWNSTLLLIAVEILSKTKKNRRPCAFNHECRSFSLIFIRLGLWQCTLKIRTSLSFILLIKNVLNKSLRCFSHTVNKFEYVKYYIFGKTKESLKISTDLSSFCFRWSLKKR
jgi:hypothetical protein